jgi:hypothetical protein
VTEHDRAARRRLVWLLLMRGELSAEKLRSDGMPALRPAGRHNVDPPETASEDAPEADAA